MKIVIMLIIGLVFAFGFIQAFFDFWKFRRNRRICAGNPSAKTGYYYNSAAVWRSQFYMLLFAILLVVWWAAWILMDVTIFLSILSVLIFLIITVIVWDNLFQQSQRSRL